MSVDVRIFAAVLAYWWQYSVQVASFIDKDQNHIEMGLHVFFGCYHNLFRLMRKCGVLQNLLVKASRPCQSDLASDLSNVVRSLAS